MRFNNNLRILSTGMGWPSAQPGGLNTYFKNICDNLTERHDLLALVCSSDKPVVREGLQVTNVAKTTLKLKQRREAFRQHASWLMDNQEFDLVYSHFAPYGVGVAQEAKNRGIPVVMTFHGPWSEEIKVEGKGFRQRIKAMIAKNMEMKAYQLADAFVVLSETFRDILHQEYQVPLSKIHIVPGAADITRFKPAAPQERIQIRNRLGISEGTTAVLTMRRLVNRMGLLQLLDAWKEVVRSVPDVLLMIGGKGPLKEELERRIQEYGLADNVRLLGYVPDNELTDYYQAADMFVVPSQSLEGFGLITVEAMATGVPVMATPVGGNREILQKFRPDLLFASKNSVDMVAGLLYAFNHRIQWPSAEACREHVLANYTWERVTEQVEGIFNSVIENHSIAYGRNQYPSIPNERKGGQESDVESRISGSYR